MFVPAFIGFVLASCTDFEKSSRLSRISGYLSIIQTLFWFIAIFTTRVSEYRSKFYVSFMPEFTYWASILAMGLMPVIIMTLNLISFLRVEEVSEFAPFGMFSFFCEAGVLVVYLLDFRGPFKEDYDEWVAWREGYYAIRRHGADHFVNNQFGTTLDYFTGKLLPWENFREDSRGPLN